MEKDSEVDVRVRAIYYLMIKQHNVWRIHKAISAGIDPRGVFLNSDREAARVIAKNKRSWEGTLGIAQRIMDKLVDE